MYQEKIPQPVETPVTAPVRQAIPVPTAPVLPQMTAGGPAYPVRTAPVYRPMQVLSPVQYAKKTVRKTVNYLSFAAIVMTGFSTLLGVVCSLFAVLACMGVSAGQQNSFGGISAEMYYLLSCVAGAVGTPTVFWLFAKLKRYDFNRLLLFEKVNFGVAVLCVLFGVGVCTVANVPAWWVADLLEKTGMTDVTTALPTATGVFSMAVEFICIAVLPPITEEFAFRGVVLSSMRPYGDGVAVVFSALLFGLVHGNAVQIPFAFLAGLALGFVYVRTDNLLVPMAVHFVNNGFSVVLEYVNTAYGEEMATTVNDVFFYATVGLGILALILLFLVRRNYFLRPEEEKERAVAPEVRILTGTERFGAAVTAPAFWCMVGLALLRSVISMLGI